jgi:phosphoserine phosphatase RsbU/P
MTEKKSILIVDDTLDNITLVAGLLKNDYKTKVATSGATALKIAMSESPPDLILLDVMMPEMDGYEVCRRLKSDEKTCEIPVIFLTAKARIDDEEKGFALGAVDYIAKPISPPILMARVKTHLILKQAQDVLKQQKEVMEHDLEIGRRIQKSFFPQSLPVIDGWEIAAHFESARQVSGDFYDAFAIPGSNCVGIVVADVCDKGVGAALFMGLFRSLIRALSNLYFDRGWISLLDGVAVRPDDDSCENRPHGKYSLAINLITRFTNNYIADTHRQANMFTTLFFGILDPECGMLYYVNGGHENPMIIGPAGVKTELEPTGPAVGMLPDMEFDVRQIELALGDMLLAFTDGVTEARSPDGSLFGEQRLTDLLGRSFGSAKALLGHIETELTEFTRGAAQSDDITMLAVFRKP